MKDGYIRVASASIDTLIGNVKHNANEIKKVLKETREKKIIGHKGGCHDGNDNDTEDSCCTRRP